MLKVKVFDREHEKDLEADMNEFLSRLDSKQIMDIKFTVAAACSSEEEQIYCFSAMIIYSE